LETLDIPQAIAEISQFFTDYGPLVSEVALIFFVIAAGVMIKTEPPKHHSQNDNETPFT